MSARSVVRQLHEVLGPLGFERRKRTWNRRSTSHVDVIDVQVSKAGDTCTVNAGVMDPEVYMTCWGSEAPAFVDESLCIVRTRIGSLMGDTDTWWEVSANEAAAQVVEAVHSHVLPFLDEMHSPAAMSDYLVEADVRGQNYPPPIIYLAILRNQLGDTASACSILTELHEAALGAWRARTSEVSARLGCG